MLTLIDDFTHECPAIYRTINLRGQGDHRAADQALHRDASAIQPGLLAVRIADAASNASLRHIEVLHHGKPYTKEGRALLAFSPNLQAAQPFQVAVCR
jgi:hypothetical protein